MAGEVRGQQLLPGAPEQLLSATKPARRPAHPKVVVYESLSLSLCDDGSWRIRRMHRAGQQPVVAVEWLDAGPDWQDVRFTQFGMLAWWASELARRDGEHPVG